MLAKNNRRHRFRFWWSTGRRQAVIFLDIFDVSSYTAWNRNGPTLYAIACSNAFWSSSDRIATFLTVEQDVSHAKFYVIVKCLDRLTSHSALPCICQGHFLCQPWDMHSICQHDVPVHFIDQDDRHNNKFHHCIECESVINYKSLIVATCNKSCLVSLHIFIGICLRLENSLVVKNVCGLKWNKHYDTSLIQGQN